MIDKVKETSFYHTKIKEWPEEERPREKLLALGPQALTDAELLALVIESGTGGITALDLAKRLLVEHESLSELASKGVAELARMKGIGPARGARILAALEVGRRIDSGKKKARVKVNSPEDVVGYILPSVRGLKKEVFKAILLDSGNKIIRDVTVSQGTLNASIVHPREVFKPAVDYLAAGVILVHNHPSGEAAPSVEDRKVTTQFLKASEVMGIPVLDHIILAGNAYFSFAKEGLLKMVMER
ncbi:MAG: DNA repair protein RadC [bacterium]